MPRDGFDASEVTRFARALEDHADRIEPAVERVLDHTIPRIAEAARAAAPEDRPWLSTSRGIIYDREGLARRVGSPLDPDGQNVGMHVEYGTSRQAPRPFLTPAFTRNAPRFVADVEGVVDHALRRL